MEETRVRGSKKGIVKSTKLKGQMQVPYIPASERKRHNN